MFNLTGRVALVTGAGSESGIGFAVARALAGAGARVAVTATGSRVLDRAAALGPGHFAASADLTDPAAVARLLALVTASLGPPDIVVNNAGMVMAGVEVPRRLVDELQDAEFAHHLALNLTTAFHVIRACLPGMRTRSYGPDCQHGLGYRPFGDHFGVWRLCHRQGRADRSDAVCRLGKCPLRRDLQRRSARLD